MESHSSSPSSSSSESCSVKVAVNVRPLIGDEVTQGCRECVSVSPVTPQVQMGTHSFTFDHVYGSNGSPSSLMFEECVAPLVDGLFHGYNATVLAYGQTGSGKTYTMGTAFKDGTRNGLIPQVMSALFNRIDSVKHQMGFQLHVSFIEILKEEVLDLLDSVPFNRLANGTPGKVVLSKSPVQIRESPNGVITLSGATEVPITTKEEMASCLEQGSLTRATGSTNMNNESSRSHAIFTITLEQMHKIPSISVVKDTVDEDMGEEYCCAKLHLVDLAGSERAKRTGSGGVRLKEGIHINRGLLALGNVISALGDEKKRKEGAHVPYRDSKLTRLLQDSLGGNSKTVMIACISPADINAEETLNTLKYANRARNIQNKPVANKDLICSEMQKMRQQLQYLQAALCARVATPEEVQVMREKIMNLESANEELSRELHIYRSKRTTLDSCNIDAQEDGVNFPKDDGLKRGFESMESDYEMSEATSGGISEDIAAAEEWEHALRQNSMGKELNELSKRLEEKESEMKICGIGTETIRQHLEKKMMELEKEKRTVQVERDLLLAEVEELAASSDRQAQVARDNHAQKLKALETQILNLKKKQENQVAVLKQKQKSEDAAKRLKAEIQCIKAQKVQLQQKMKQEAEQFRQWKASQEKELLQLKKEGRKTEHERLKLEALNRRQKMVLQRKTEEAAMATKRLKELLEARKSSLSVFPVTTNGQPPTRQMNEKTLRKWLDNELEVMAKVHQVRFQYEKQIQVRAALAEELTSLKQEIEFPSSPHQEKNGQFRFLSPNTRLERIASLESMLDVSSNALTAMASQLSEAEEREHSLHAKTQWNHVQSMTDAKYLLQYVFDSTAEARCKIWEKDKDIKEKKEQLNDLLCLLQLTEVQNREIVKEKKTREQTVSIALASSSSSYSGSSRSSSKHYGDNNASDPSSPSSSYHRATKHLKYAGPGIVNISVRESEALLEETRKMKAMKKMGQSGKLWKWKRSHHQWLLQFKWKWQKPWKLSEWIKQNDETTMHFMSKSHHDDDNDHSWNRHSLFQGA
ncbi:KICP-02 [Arabidopsis lyrata subsp. lyrata]|uniref:KICP-02 n=1 Tax=Arabidopsis lyrata subsp. lyrata TaxID=81972 RepID=D7LT39_ARALL|nr:KICP-02 [Arabidopsis lyrata subsp. lyrata]